MSDFFSLVVDSEKMTCPIFFFGRPGNPAHRKDDEVEDDAAALCCSYIALQALRRARIFLGCSAASQPRFKRWNFATGASSTLFREFVYVRLVKSGAHSLELVNRFPKRVRLQKSVSIEPRTSSDTLARQSRHWSKGSSSSQVLVGWERGGVNFTTP